MGILNSIIRRVKLWEASRMMKEFMKNPKLHKKNIKLVRKAGMLRSPQTMETGLKKGADNIISRNNFQVIHDPKLGPLQGSTQGSTRTVHISPKAGPIERKHEAQEVQEFVKRGNNPNESSMVFRKNGSGRDDASHIDIRGHTGIKIGQHHTLAVLGRERNDLTRLKIHKAGGDERKTINAFRKSGGEKDLIGGKSFYSAKDLKLLRKKKPSMRVKAEETLGREHRAALDSIRNQTPEFKAEAKNTATEKVAKAVRAANEIENQRINVHMVYPKPKPTHKVGQRIDPGGRIVNKSKLSAKSMFATKKLRRKGTISDPSISMNTYAKSKNFAAERN